AMPDVAYAADASAQSVSVQVSEPTSCTSVEDLSARVSKRLPQVRFDDGAPSLIAKARFVATDVGVTGELTLAKPGAVASLRRVLARSCEQAVEAVALIIAVTLDPSSGQASSTPSATEQSGEPTPSERPKPPPPPSVLDGKVAVNPPKNEPKDSPRWSAQLAGQAVVGVAPQVMPGVGIFALVGLDREQLWSPALMFGVSRAGRTGFERQGGTAAFVLEAASLDLCPLRLHASAFETRACLSSLLARLSATGSDTNKPTGTAHRPFVAVGAALLATARLHPLIELSTRLGLSANLIRDSFEFAPYAFHEVAPLTFSASVGVGLRSP
ncbi:MAG TPA: hypothetical protein VMF89_34190, partial [Polyangiales bacterium]|nr:hypothetical protein [Polyangiales bacterium]